MNTYITGSVIKRLREEKGITQNELAEKIGCLFYSSNSSAIFIIYGFFIVRILDFPFGLLPRFFGFQKSSSPYKL
ncbi:MAG: helix-turn-helix transcriptional regulator [Clostridia bacterium]|nr:helix-turn-helix transcriptional regulator [Clostridia bacterium]